MPGTVYLSQKRLQAPVANLAALKAVSVASVDDSVIVVVTTLGIYQYSSSSTATPDDNLIVQPTVGSGRWLLVQLGFTNQGNWNASTNSPSLTSSVGNRGDYYTVSVAGSTSLNGTSTWVLGDHVIFNGSIWQRIPDGANMATVANNQASITRLQAPVSNLAALKAVSVTGVNDGVLIEVITLGIYQYASSSTATPDDNLVVQPTAGSGRWLLVQLGFTNKGNWNANTNSPTLVSSVGNRGDYYTVSVAGSTNLDGTSTWLLGDHTVFNGTEWQRIPDGANMVTVTDQVIASQLGQPNEIAELDSNAKLLYAEMPSAITLGNQAVTNAGPSYGPIQLTNPMKRWTHYNVQNGDFSACSLPDMTEATAPAVGQIFTIENTSTFIGIVRNFGGAAVEYLYPGQITSFLVTDTSTSNGTFEIINSSVAFTFPTVFNYGAFSTVSPINVRIVRNNSLITLVIPPINISISATTSQITSNTAIPADFIPSQGVRGAGMYFPESTSPGAIASTLINSDGIIYVQSSTGGTFSASTSILMDPFSISYYVPTL